MKRLMQPLLYPWRVLAALEQIVRLLREIRDLLTPSEEMADHLAMTAGPVTERTEKE